MATAPEADTSLDAVFADLVKESWHYHHMVENTTHVDELLVGGLIVVALDAGHVLIDITSDGTNHFLRFENLDDRSRVTMAVTHLTLDVTMAKAIGQRAGLIVGYGEPIQSFGRVFEALRQETKSGYLGRAEPGIVSFDADSESQYVYAQVDLYLDMNLYVGGAFDINYDLLGTHVAATINALRKFLRGRTGA
jgi:hypothetical protein